MSRDVQPALSSGAGAVDGPASGVGRHDGPGVDRTRLLCVTLLSPGAKVRHIEKLPRPHQREWCTTSPVLRRPRFSDGEGRSSARCPIERAPMGV
jgi:hypothetical protein